MPLLRQAPEEHPHLWPRRLPGEGRRLEQQAAVRVWIGGRIAWRVACRWPVCITVGAALFGKGLPQGMCATVIMREVVMAFTGVRRISLGGIVMSRRAGRTSPESSTPEKPTIIRHPKTADASLARFRRVVGSVALRGPVPSQKFLDERADRLVGRGSD